jgi:uncharacterized Zn finger protein
MHLNLHDFEKYVNASILKRGQSYLRQGRIMTLEEEEGHPGSWLASVEGSYDDYEVHIFINEEEQITLCDCSCPYDWGEYCKHVVAVLLKIRTLQLSRGYKKKTVSRNVKKPSVEEMLEQFKELPLIEQRILKILALYWEPSSADNIATLYKECRFENKAANNLSTLSMRRFSFCFLKKSWSVPTTAIFNCPMNMPMLYVMNTTLPMRI